MFHIQKMKNLFSALFTTLSPITIVENHFELEATKEEDGQKDEDEVTSKVEPEDDHMCNSIDDQKVESEDNRMCNPKDDQKVEPEDDRMCNSIGDQTVEPEVDHMYNPKDEQEIRNIECIECTSLRFQNKCLLGLFLLTSFLYFKKK